MTDLINEIRRHFASGIQGMRQISCLPNKFEAYTFRQGVEYGVGIKLENISDLIYEESAQITIKILSNLDDNYLVLSCCEEVFRNEFAKFGAYFVEPGENGENRKLVLNSPMDWWENWIGMLGNKISSRNSYDVVAEMMALVELYEQDHTVEWSSTHAGSHDIESQDKAFEIKSTIKKNDSTITISSQFQLSSDCPLELWFYRMELSENGMSINDLKESLIKCGYKEEWIESQLSKRGFQLGKSIRDRKYVVLERRKYEVDENFPKIVASSFKNDVYPKNIVKILYSINLDGLPYTN